MTPPWVRTSLRLRLAIWYSGLTIVVVVSCAVYSFAVHGRAHYDELDRMLHHVTEHVADELASARSLRDRSETLTAARLLGPEVRVYGAGGEPWRLTPVPVRAPVIDPRALLRGSSRPPYGALTRLAPALRRETPARGVFGVIVAADAARWRVFALRVDATTPYLVASVPLADLDASVRRFAWLMFGMAVFGCTFVGVGGWLIAGRALRPVAVLADTARGIAESGAFDRRVPVARSGLRSGAHDRNELARLADSFNAMLVRLEAAYTGQQRFVADASHELRAPVTVVRANLQLLRRVPPLAPTDQTAALADANAEADRLARLVNNLLSLARADAGLPLRHESVELDRVLMLVLGEVRSLTRGQGLEVGPLEQIAVVGDPDQLQQLVLILLDNALKYTPADGSVRVSLVRRPAAAPAPLVEDRRRLRLSTRRGAKALPRDNGRKEVAELRVEDTGIGIAAADLPQVFTRFFRADPARSRDRGGTGLGLSIALWIATQHGGRLRLESTLGSGTTAVLELPIGGERDRNTA